MKQPNDFLVKRQEKNESESPDTGARFTYFGPEDSQERFRFLIVREAGDDVSVVPITDARFKVGLRAWRWKEEKGGAPETYVVVKTKSNRVDLRKRAAPDA
jgi:hypothetical protein